MSFWKLSASKLNGIAQTTAASSAASLIGGGLDWLQNQIGGGRGGHVRFYYDYNGGGSIFNVVARKAISDTASQIKNEVVSQYKQLIGGKKFDQGYYKGSVATTAAQMKKQEEEQSKYGTLYGMAAVDDWGNVCYDALMLGIPEGMGYSIDTDVIGSKTSSYGSTISEHPVWYDTTALVTVSSDKDLILTRVTGRDYSRKELVANGDMMFSVSGHITSRMPDIYPTNEVQKFRTMMEYKGILDVNNEIFDQWGVTKIVIRSFNLPPNEGNKSTQDYSFECVGIQPETDAVVRDDTITIIDDELISETDANKELSWKDILKGQIDAAKNVSVDVVNQGLGIANGILDGVI